MSRIVFDIETAGQDFESLDPETREYLLKWTETEDDVVKVKESLSFFPQTGEIVAIGMLNPDTSRGAVYFQCPDHSVSAFENNGIAFEPATEKGILEHFWATVNKYSQIITFNGRGFDCPYILVRTAVHQIRPTRELMPNRYNSEHLDLFDRLSFFGASKKKFNLDTWCRTFKIKSPKSEGITGYQIKELFDSGQYKDIATYCAGDLFATRDLLFVWERHIKFPPEE